MSTITRRNFLKLGTAGSGLAAAGLGTGAALAGTVKLDQAGRDFSFETGKERKAVPSSCWQCVTRDGIIGYVEDGRLAKIEGNHKLPRTNGKLCSRGQAGVNVLYNPDRLLYPLKRVGKRGEGKWQKISWDEWKQIPALYHLWVGREYRSLFAYPPAVQKGFAGS